MDNAIALSLFVAFMWGIQPVLHKHLIKSISFKTVMVISAAIYFAGILVFGIVFRKDIKKDWPKLTLRTLSILFGITLFTVFLTNLIYFFVLKNHKSFVVAAIMYSAPIFTLLCGFLFLKEKVTLVGLLGIVSIIFGVMCIAFVEETTSKLIDDFKFE